MMPRYIYCFIHSEHGGVLLGLLEQAVWDGVQAQQVYGIATEFKEHAFRPVGGTGSGKDHGRDSFDSFEKQGLEWNVGPTKSSLDYGPKTFR
jgi:hypothetical protein